MRQIRLFSTDLDGTLLGNPEGAWRFASRWAAIDPRRRPLLVYNTGRTVADTLALLGARQLPAPDAIIAGMGTDLHDTLYNLGAEFRAQFGRNWNPSRIEEIVGAVPGIKRQPPDPAAPLKSSWLWMRARREDLDQLDQALRRAGVHATLIYSCRYFLDIVPPEAGKGRPLAWLCDRLSIPLRHVLVAGDSASDAAMFLLRGVHGIIVENALPELHAAVVDPHVYVARQPMADGVLEGLAHFGVLDAQASASPACA